MKIKIYYFYLNLTKLRETRYIIWPKIKNLKIILWFGWVIKYFSKTIDISFLYACIKLYSFNVLSTKIYILLLFCLYLPSLICFKLSFFVFFYLYIIRIHITFLTIYFKVNFNFFMIYYLEYLYRNIVFVNNCYHLVSSRKYF